MPRKKKPPRPVNEFLVIRKPRKRHFVIYYSLPRPIIKAKFAGRKFKALPGKGLKNLDKCCRGMFK